MITLSGLLPLTVPRATKAVTATVLILGVLAATLALTTTPADAAWTKAATKHRATISICKVQPKDRNGWWLRGRVDNRKGRHYHVGGVGRLTNGFEPDKQIKLPAKAGKRSPIKMLKWKRGYWVSVSLGDSWYAEVEDVALARYDSLSEIRRC